MRWFRFGGWRGDGFALREKFEFRDDPLGGRRIDGDVELVEPAATWIEPMLLAAGHPANAGEPIGRTTRAELLRFLDRYPRGHEAPLPGRSRPPSYTFWIRLRNPPPGVPEMAGTISLRIGETEDLRRYLGHVGYGVYPPARGRHLAERATRLLLPLAKSHDMKELWITANPDNLASCRTCERLGGTLVGTVDLPIGHPLYLRGDRRKHRYRIDL